MSSFYYQNKTLTELFGEPDKTVDTEQLKWALNYLSIEVMDVVEEYEETHEYPFCKVEIARKAVKIVEDFVKIYMD